VRPVVTTTTITTIIIITTTLIVTSTTTIIIIKALEEGCETCRIDAIDWGTDTRLYTLYEVIYSHMNCLSIHK
jgi:hypothetical protein